MKEKTTEMRTLKKGLRLECKAVSLWKNVEATSSVPVRLDDTLRLCWHKGEKKMEEDLIIPLKQPDLKGKAACITPHALFFGRRRLDDPYILSGGLFYDIDYKDKEADGTEVKKKVKVLYDTLSQEKKAGGIFKYLKALKTSVSGKGLHAFMTMNYADLLLIERSEGKAEAFTEVWQYFSEMLQKKIDTIVEGFIVDPICKDITRMCILNGGLVYIGLAKELPKVLKAPVKKKSLKVE